MPIITANMLNKYDDQAGSPILKAMYDTGITIMYSEPLIKLGRIIFPVACMPVTTRNDILPNAANSKVSTQNIDAYSGTVPSQM